MSGVQGELKPFTLKVAHGHKVKAVYASIKKP